MNTPPATIEPAAVVDRTIDYLLSSYVFPESAQRAADLLQARLHAGDYDADAEELCERISADLFEATQDKHLRLLWHDEIGGSRSEEELVAGIRELFRSENYGVRRVERLEGNLGLIELTLVPEAESGGPALVAAMRLVEHTRALVLDLRATRGGSPDGVAFLVSHLFPDGETRLCDIVAGPNGPARQYWTYASVPGPRYLDRPVFVLTSDSTFSGGEQLAYDLQALGRAQVVGETTRGGAHPSQVVSLSDHIELRLPVARTVNPVTGGNWEGVGVQPDHPVAAADALATAQRLALERG